MLNQSHLPSSPELLYSTKPNVEEVNSSQRLSSIWLRSTTLGGSSTLGGVALEWEWRGHIFICDKASGPADLLRVTLPPPVPSRSGWDLGKSPSSIFPARHASHTVRRFWEGSGGSHCSCVLQWVLVVERITVCCLVFLLLAASKESVVQRLGFSW